MNISKIYIEYQEEPIGLDVERPRFSWMLEAEERDVMQVSCRVRVCTGGRQVWDSGRISTADSQGIVYEGEKLRPCTEYTVEISVWDNHGNTAKENTRFETGFLNPSIDAWDGAKWIGAPRYTVCAANRGVFVLEAVRRASDVPFRDPCQYQGDADPSGDGETGVWVGML